MPIVPQSTPVSHSPFLLLCAPKIAGLLPAHAASLHSADAPPADTLTYTNPNLANLPPYIKTEMQRLLAAMLDGAVEMLTGGAVDEYDFFEMAQRFTGQMQLLYNDNVIIHTGPYKESDRPRTPFRTLAQMEADADAIKAESIARMAVVLKRNRARLAAIYRGEEDDEADS